MDKGEKNEKSNMEFLRKTLGREKNLNIEELEKAATELAFMYEMDEELVAFTSLDGEDFL